MSSWNYVATMRKPTNVTHSCVGKFTDSLKCNLLVAKCTLIEIHIFSPEGLQPLQHMIDVPLRGRILTFELFRPYGEDRDLLFVATERYRFCILGWDAKTSEVITRHTGDAWYPAVSPTQNRKICTIDPSGRLILFHLYDGICKVFPFTAGQLGEPFNIRTSSHILDIKFLYGCETPTVIVLYKIKTGHSFSSRVRAYAVSPVSKQPVRRKGLQLSLPVGAHLMIPVPEPLCGILIASKNEISYIKVRGRTLRTTIDPNHPTTTIRAYGIVDCDGRRYLLGDQNGILYNLDIICVQNRATGLNINPLGVTSVASSISYLDTAAIFVGSSCGDSQLVKINPHLEGNASLVQVLEHFENLGPVVDFCVVDFEKRGQCQLITCSGAYKDGSLRIVSYGIGINEEASVEFRGINGMWSLRLATDDPYDTFLVVSFVSETRILAMNTEDELEETEIEGFSSDVQTLFCHDAIHDQLVQVTSKEVRLVSSTTRRLLSNWVAPDSCSVNVATANATQVLLATSGRHLIYLEIDDGLLTEVGGIQLEYYVSCLDINPIGDCPNKSKLAAVGMWNEISIRIYSLSNLNLVTTELLGGEIIPRSVLMCSLDGVPYLLCALGDGHLLNFLFNTSNGQLTDRKKVSLGTEPITLRTFSSKGATRVFAVSARSTIVHRSYGFLHYSTVNLKKARHMCPFNSAAFPESVAIANEEELIFGGIGDSETLHSITKLSLQQTADLICHQESSRTLLVCNLKMQEDSGPLSIWSLDDNTFDTLSTYRLHQFERIYSIISCTFDKNEYYCVGTGYKRNKKEAEKGRILVFQIRVHDRELCLITSTVTEGVVYNIEASNGWLFAAVNWKTTSYKWVSEPRGLYRRRREENFVDGYLINSITKLLYETEEGPIEGEEGSIEDKEGSDEYQDPIIYVETLHNDIYIGSDNNFNIFAIRKHEGIISEVQGNLEVVGRYHLGEYVHRFRRGSFGSPIAEIQGIPTVLFGTDSGIIGVVACLPQREYMLLEALQRNMRTMVTVVGGMSHDDWRSFYNENVIEAAKNFLDGDFIRLFLDLSTDQKEHISAAVGVRVETLMATVQELTMLQ